MVYLQQFLFVYTMSQVDKHACMQLSIWRMYIIELISEMMYEVYKRVGISLLDYTMSQVDKHACMQLSIWRKNLKYEVTMKNIKNIVFDVGMVLVDFCWKEHCRNLGFDESVIEAFDQYMVMSDCWDQMDEGTMSEEKAIEYFVSVIPQYEAEIRKFWDTKEGFVKEYDYATPMISRLQEKGYKVYLLSNYPKEMYQVHWPVFSFYNQVDGYIVSALECMRKPNPAIYKLLCERFALLPQECLFIDDRQSNVDAAISVGMSGILFEEYEQLADYLSCIM